jgi:hypothetical protein
LLRNECSNAARSVSGDASTPVALVLIHNPKTVNADDADLNAVDGMATGAFATQAQHFFNASIRKPLEQALAESRGQIRYVVVQSENQSAGTASVSAVVDQTSVNNKITSPQADVVRLVADLKLVNGVWKISDVTVLEGTTPASTGSASGSAGSNVPGQEGDCPGLGSCRAACGSVVESRGQSQAKRPT